jgi:hypothetical protein
MKRILILSLLGALLGGCVIVPLGYGYRDDGYYRGGAVTTMGTATIVGTATGGMATGITAANERSQYQNRRSRSIGIVRHVASESAVTLVRNYPLRASAGPLRALFCATGGCGVARDAPRDQRTGT